MTPDEAWAQLTFLTGRIADISREAGLNSPSTTEILIDIEESIDMLKIKLRQKEEENK